MLLLCLLWYLLYLLCWFLRNLRYLGKVYLLGPFLLGVLVGESRCSIPTSSIPSASLIGESIVLRLIVVVVVKILLVIVLPVVGESVLISLPSVGRAIILITVPSGVESFTTTASLRLVSSGVENIGLCFDVEISLLQFLRSFGDFAEIPCL